MSRSSTPNFIQGARKVNEFIQAQIKSGSEALSSFFDVQKAKDISGLYLFNLNLYKINFKLYKHDY